VARDRRGGAAEEPPFHRRRGVDGSAPRRSPAGRRDRLRAPLVALICDTGPLYAVLDRADADHRICAELLSGSEDRLVVPAPVIVELDWLSGNRLGPEPFAAFLADVEDGAISVVDLVRPDYQRVGELLARYSDLRLGFVDAAIVAVVERLGEQKLATLDRRHFGMIRPSHVEALDLLRA